MMMPRRPVPQPLNVSLNMHKTHRKGNESLTSCFGRNGLKICLFFDIEIDLHEFVRRTIARTKKDRNALTEECTNYRKSNHISY